MLRAHPTDFVKYGGGLPSNADIHTSFIAAQSKIAHEAVDSGVPHHHQPAVAEFEKTIVDDAEMKDLFEKILDEIHEKSKVSDYAGACRMQMLTPYRSLAMKNCSTCSTPSFHPLLPSMSLRMTMGRNLANP